MNRKSGNDDLDEVDSLLRAAQDEVLLNLSVNSHMSRGTSETSYMDPDLNSRFQALKSSRSTTRKSPAQPSSSAKPKSTPVKVKGKDDGGDIGEDDLFARFTALKSSLPSSSSVSNPKDEKLTRFESGGAGEDEEDEVQKLIQWAIDAARLDPSPPSDEDVEEDDGSSKAGDDSDDDSDDDHRKIATKKKGKKKKK